MVIVRPIATQNKAAKKDVKLRSNISNLSYAILDLV